MSWLEKGQIGSSQELGNGTTWGSFSLAWLGQEWCQTLFQLFHATRQTHNKNQELQQNIICRRSEAG